MTLATRSLLQLALPAAMTLWAGCTPTQYAQQADRTGYATIRDGQQDALGQAYGLDIAYRPYATTAPSEPIAAGGKLIGYDNDHPTILSLDDCLNIAARNNRALQTQKEDIFINALELANARRGWDVPKFDGPITADASRVVTGEGSRVNAGAVSATPTLTQRLVNGGTLGLAASLNLASDLLGSDSTTVGSLLQANLTQPLLRGAWGGLAYEKQYRVERDFLFDLFTYERFTQTFAVDIVRTYFNVLRLRDQLENQKANIQRLKQTLALTKVLVGGGQVSRIQQDQAESDVLNAEVTFEASVQSYRDALDQFKLKLGLPLRTAIELDYPDALGSLVTAGPAPLPLDEPQAVELALSARPDVLAARAKYRDAQRNIDIAADQFLPQLDVTAAISAPGTPPRDFQRVQFDRHTRSAAVHFSYNLDQTDNRNAYRQALILALRARRDLDEFTDSVRLEVLQSYRTLLQSRKVFELQLRNVEIAKRRSKLASLQQKEGQATARDVLEAEAQLLSVQNGLTSAIVTYATTRLQFLASLGMIGIDEKGEIHERSEPFRFDRLGRQYPYVTQP